MTGVRAGGGLALNGGGGGFGLLLLETTVNPSVGTGNSTISRAWITHSRVEGNLDLVGVLRAPARKRHFSESLLKSQSQIKRLPYLPVQSKATNEHVSFYTMFGETPPSSEHTSTLGEKTLDL